MFRCFLHSCGAVFQQYSCIAFFSVSCFAELSKWSACELVQAYDSCRAVHMRYVTCPTVYAPSQFGGLFGLTARNSKLPLCLSLLLLPCLSVIACSFSSTATPASTCRLRLGVHYVLLIIPLYLCKLLSRE